VIFAIEFDPQAIVDLKKLRAFDRTVVVDMIEKALRNAPTQTSQSRIKRLRGLDTPQYRLRVGDFRVFYDVLEADARVYVFRVMAKSETEQYLREMGYES
jgi:mRNA interferase RelE/StbE